MRSTTLRTARELRAIKLPRVDLARLDLARSSPEPIELPPLELPPELSIVPPAVPVEVLPKRLRAAQLGAERMTSIMATGRVFTLPAFTGSRVGPWAIFECERPTLILQRAPAGSAVDAAIEAMPGRNVVPTFSETNPLTASGRSLILPWGGTWWLRQASLGDAGVNTTAQATAFIAFEAPPGVSATDLLTMKGSGHVSWSHGTLAIADVVDHLLLNADANRQALIISISTASVGLYVTLDGGPATIASGIPTSSTLPPIRFTSDDVPLGAIHVITNIATPCTVAWHVAYQ